MSDSVLETQAKAIKAHLEGITEAAGYGVTVSEVVRPTRLGGFTVNHLQVLQEQGDREAAEETVNGKQTWVQPFLLQLVIMPSDTDATPYNTLENNFIAAVEKRFCGDESWMTTGTIEYEIQGPQVVSDTTVPLGVLVTLNVTYRHVYGDPYTA